VQHSEQQRKYGGKWAVRCGKGKRYSELHVMERVMAMMWGMSQGRDELKKETGLEDDRRGIGAY
jgi:hypothetical protein